MANIQLEALTDIIFKPSKESTKNFEKAVALLLDRAEIPHKVDIPIDPQFRLKDRAAALKQIERLNDELESALLDQSDRHSPASRAIIQQQELLNNLNETLKTTSSLSSRVRASGQKAIQSLLSGKEDFRDLSPAKQQNVRRVSAEQQLQARRVQRIAGGLSAGGFDIPALQEFSNNLRKENAQLTKLTDTEYLLERDRKAAAKQERESTQAKSKREQERKRRFAQERQIEDKRRRAVKARIKATEKSTDQTRQSTVDEGRLREGRLALIRARRGGVGLDKFGSQRQIDVARFALEHERGAIQRRFSERDAGLRGPSLASRDQTRLDQVVSALSDLKRAQKNLGDSTRDATEAERERRKEIRETAQATREAAADERRRQKDLDRSSKDAIEVARVREGQRILDQFGGPSAVSSIPREKLPLATEAIKSQLEDLTRLRDSLLRAGRSVDHLDGEFKKLNDSLRDSKGRMKGMNSAVKEFGLLFRQFLRLGVGFGIIFEVVYGIQALITELVRLNTALKDIQAATTGTSEEMLQVESAIERVASQTKFSVSEIAEAAKILSQAGIDPSNLNNVLSSVANFASATSASIQTAADLVSSMRTVFKDLDDLTIANQLTRVVNVSKTTAEDLQTIVSLGAQTANRFNLTSSQFLAAAATLRDAGIRASTVGTGLRHALLELFTPDSGVIKALKARYASLGEELSEAAIRNRFFSFSQTDNPLVAALKELRRLGFAEGEGKSFFQNAFDIRSSNAIVALVDNLDKLQKNQAAIPFSNAAINASRTQMEGLAASVENLGSAITVMTNSIAGGLLPTLEKMADGLTNVVEKVTKLNDKMVAETGVGLGSIITGGALSGAATFFSSRGGIATRLLKGAAGGVAGSAVGLSLQSPTASSTTNQVTALVGSILASSAISAVIDKVVQAAKTPAAAVLNRGRSAASVVGNVGSAAAGVGAIGTVVGGVKSFFGKLGEAASKILTKLPWLKSVGAILLRINPWVAGITTIAAAIAIGSKFFGGGKVAAARKQFEQSLQNFDKRLNDFKEQSKLIAQFKLSDSGLGAKKGTGAAVLEDLENQQRQFQIDLDNFFGGTVENVKAVREVLQRLAHQGSVEGSQAQKDLIGDLAGVAKVRDSQGNRVGLNASALLARSGQIGDLANDFSEIRNKTNSLQEQLVRLVASLEDAEGELEPFQQALVDFVNQADSRAFQFFTGQITLPPAEAQALIRKLFEAATQAGEASLEQVRLDQGEVAGFVNRILDAETRTDIRNAYQELANRALQVGVDSSELLSKVNAQINVQKNKVNRTNFVADTFRGLFGVEKETSTADQLRLKNLELAREAAKARVAEDARNRALNKEDVTNQAELIRRRVVEALKNEKLGFGKFVEGDEISKRDRQLVLNSVSSSLKPEGLLVDADKSGLLSLSPQAKRIDQLLTSFIETKQKQLEASDKIFIQSFERQKRLVELDSELERIKRENLGVEAEKKVLNEKAKIQLQNIDAQIAHQAGLLDDAETPSALANAQKQMQSLRLERIRIESEHNQAIASLNEEEQDRRRKIVGELLQAEQTRLQKEFDRLTDSTDAKLEDFEALDAKRKELLEKLLKLEQQKLEDEGATNEQIKIRLEEIKRQNKSYFKQTDILAQITQSLASVREANKAQSTPVADTVEGAKRQALGFDFSTAEKNQALDSFILKQEKAVKDLEEVIARAKENGLSGTDFVKEKVRQRDSLNVNIGQAQADKTQLNQTAAGGLVDGLNPQKLATALDNAQSSVKNLSANIRGDLVSAIQSAGQHFDEFFGALIQGKNVADGLKNAFKSLGLQIAQTIQQTIVNSFVKSLLTKGASMLSGAGGAGGFIASLFSSGAAASKGASDLRMSGGGVIRGKGTPTSDSIRGVIYDSNTGRPVRGIRVSDREAILNAKAVDLLGRGFIDAINTGSVAMMNSGGLISETGKRTQGTFYKSDSMLSGVVDSLKSSGKMDTRTSNDVKVKIVNAIDPAFVEDYLATPGGERVLVNTVRRNASAIREVLR